MDVIEKAAGVLNENGLLALVVGKYASHDISDDIIFASRNFLSVDRFLYYHVPSISYCRGFKPTKREKIIVFNKR